MRIHAPDWPEITTLMPHEFSKMYQNGTLPQFDAVVTHSSIEHSGLGRYGDQLNPWGDLITMAKIWCVMKTGAQALIGVPHGPDTVVFNSHKIYGPTMYSHIFANFKQVWTNADMKFYRESCNYCYQPVHLIE